MTPSTTALIAELNEKREKAEATRLQADYLNQDYPESGQVEGWRIHDLPDDSMMAVFICGGLEKEWAELLVAAVNSVPTLAAEIARLEGENERAKDELKSAWSSNHRWKVRTEAAEAEASRLREALSEIASNMHEPGASTYQSELERRKEIARAALQQQAEEIG